jgi:hypothetical protein
MPRTIDWSFISQKIEWIFLFFSSFFYFLNLFFLVPTCETSCNSFFWKFSKMCNI